MLIELEKLMVRYSQQNGYCKDDFIQSAQILLKKQFIWSDGHGQKKHYLMIIVHKQYYENLFDALGFDFIHDEKFEYCGIIPRNSTPSLNKLETIFLLLLARLHDSESQKARTEKGRSRPSPGLLIDAYCEISKKEKPKRVETINALEHLSKQGIIVLSEIDEDSNLPQIVVLPCITKVVSSSYIEELEGFIEEQNKKQFKHNS